MRSRSTLARVLLATTAVLAAGGTAACGEDAGGPAGAEDGRLAVVTAFYPLQFISERVGGDAVTVSNLTKPGAEPHDLELNPRQVGQINDAGLIVYLKGFQPQIDEAVQQQAADRAFDVSTIAPLLNAAAATHADDATHTDDAAHADEQEGEQHEESAGGKDPHVWLDPTRLADIADRLADRLAAADPAHAADYPARAKALRADLTALDGEFTQQLTTCKRREIVTSHAAFSYLAVRYRLEQIAISGLSPDEEASARRYAQVAEEAREHGATTIFFETLVSPRTAETIAKEVGAKTAVLDPLEGLGTAGGDYLTVMRANLTALTTALDCS